MLPQNIFALFVEPFEGRFGAIVVVNVQYYLHIIKCKSCFV